MKPMKFAGAAAACLIAPLPAAAAPPAPRLILAISVDQFSADLYAAYRASFTGGLKRLGEGAVFPSGYQSHAATETCPGHSTILTGSHPARTGIIANNWFDLSLPEGKQKVYCAEDPALRSAGSDDYVPSPHYLKVPTLGDRMKAANPASRSIAVSGKDRGAIMMGGHDTDAIWFWGGKRFVTLPGRTGTEPAIVSEINARVAAIVSRPPRAVLPAQCRARDRSVAIGQGKSVGRLTDRKAEDFGGFRRAIEFDALTGDLAIGLMRAMRLGQGAAPDILAVSFSATDYVGHAYGPGGAEMCAQLTALDATIGKLLAAADATGVPYAVVLTADHGGLDLTERELEQAIPRAARVDKAVDGRPIGDAVKSELGLRFDGPLLYTDGAFGDYYLSRAVPADQRDRALSLVRAKLLALPQVADVLLADDLRRVRPGAMPVDEWSLPERFAASFDPSRSGDLLVALKPQVTPIVDPTKGYVATHGSPWQYDRRVPMLFWRSGGEGFEQPLPVETVDILPTLAALIGLPVPADEIDGRCLDLDPGAGDSCKAAR